MRIVCPDCSAAYEVPDSLLAAGTRALRCVRCGLEWVPALAESPGPPAPQPASAAATPSDTPLGAPSDAPPGIAERVAATPAAALRLPRPPAARVPVAPPPPADSLLTDFSPLVGRPARRSERAAILAWVASIGLVLLLAYAAYVWRAEVQAVWPASQRAYAALGLR